MLYEVITVMLCGLEEGLFPLSRSMDSVEEVEEERRLFYVGITRARERLLLTWAHRRRDDAKAVVAWLAEIHKTRNNFV